MSVTNQGKPADPTWRRSLSFAPPRGKEKRRSGLAHSRRRAQPAILDPSLQLSPAERKSQMPVSPGPGFPERTQSWVPVTFSQRG